MEMMMMKPKAKYLYIWEGFNTFCITRGYPPEFKGNLVCMKVKHKGLIGSKYTSCNNIPDIYIGPPKHLMVKEKILDGWNVVKVSCDAKDLVPHVPDLPTNLIRKIAGLENEVKMWRTMYYQEKEKNLTRENKQLFDERIHKELEKTNKWKNLVYPQSSYDSPFGRPLWGGLGGVPPPPSGD